MIHGPVILAALHAVGQILREEQELSKPRCATCGTPAEPEGCVNPKCHSR